MLRKILKNNAIIKRPNIQGATGSVSRFEYTVDLGTILYNEKFLSLGNMIIPIEAQSFFNMPEDSGKYAAVNVYYDISQGSFYYDKVGTFSTYRSKVSSNVLSNKIPIGQFILHQIDDTFEVSNVNEYSKMSTFSVSDTFIQGDTGLKGLQGITGPKGYEGAKGDQGSTGPRGSTGSMGITGAPLQGFRGAQGETGLSPDKDVIFYLKFDNSYNRQVDHSIYERDVYFSATGAYNTIGAEASFYTGINGIVDGAHSVYYDGGLSSYKRNEYIDFGSETGVISSWIKLNQAPVPSFTFRVDSTDSKLIIFTDTSTGDPTSWQWYFGYDSSSIDGDTYLNTSTNQNPSFKFSSAGEYLVKLIATNGGGSSEICHFVTAV